MSNLVALLTDFGIDDIYVGVMKGVMHNIYPEIQLVDVTHAIRPQSVRGGAIALKNSYQYFPKGTVFLVVVDPGVGSARRPIIVKTEAYTFVAPDNGVLSYALDGQGPFHAFELGNKQYQLEQVSHTFHGRDVFAPAAAYAARGDVSSADFGRSLQDIFMLPEPQVHIADEQITGEVIHIDRFGNIITSIHELRWVGDGRLVLSHPEGKVRMMADNISVTLHGHTIQGIVKAYHELPRGSLLSQVDSNGYLEVAINQGNATKRLDAVIGDIVELNYKKAQTGLLSNLT